MVEAVTYQFNPCILCYWIGVYLFHCYLIVVYVEVHKTWIWAICITVQWPHHEFWFDVYFRLQGMTITHSKVPTHRRRFEDLVKTLEAYSKDTNRSSSFQKELPNKGMSSSLRKDSLKSSTSIRKEGSNRFLPSRSVVDVTEASSREIAPPTEDEAVWAFMSLCIPGNCVESRSCKWIGWVVSVLKFLQQRSRCKLFVEGAVWMPKISEPFAWGTD